MTTTIDATIEVTELEVRNGDYRLRARKRSDRWLIEESAVNVSIWVPTLEVAQETLVRLCEIGARMLEAQRAVDAIAEEYRTTAWEASA